MITATGPGRVNLIGDHTDYSGGLVMPMAINLSTVVQGEPGGEFVELHSSDEQEPAIVALDIEDPSTITPSWARYVAGVVSELRPQQGFKGTVTTTLPIGAGLSSSAALEVAVALALGFDGTSLELAKLTQRGEQRASGVPCGIMDQLSSASGVDGSALMIDCHDLTVTAVEVPANCEIRVIHSGQARELAGSAYADRFDDVTAAQVVLGPLRDITTLDALSALDDERLLRRARHVVSENARVRAFHDAFRRSDLVSAGRLMVQSHCSLRDDFDVSTPVLDELVERLCATDGVYGARLTGAGFGGCVVALCQPGAIDEGWHVTPSSGAHVNS
ncbi:MAG: hypothetical protein KDA95_03755 [Acidimicrobiales bacterium]|nr:hypothetical protein [Acidimicrobiales bacterium]